MIGFASSRGSTAPLLIPWHQVLFHETWYQTSPDPGCRLEFYSAGHCRVVSPLPAGRAFHPGRPHPPLVAICLGAASVEEAAVAVSPDRSCRGCGYSQGCKLVAAPFSPTQNGLMHHRRGANLPTAKSNH